MSKDDFSQQRSSLSRPRQALLEKWLKGKPKAASESQRIPRRAAQERIPASFAQQQLWFLDQLAPGNPFYNIPAAVRLSGEVDVEALNQSLNQLATRHENLRTSFDLIDDQPIQVVTPSLSLPLPVVDLRDVNASEREAKAIRLAIQEARQPFDLRQAPLWRAKVLRLGDDQYMLLLVIHHIISDEWSLGVLLREIGIFYEASITGQAPTLPDLPVQYADFAVWQQQWFDGEACQQSLHYWKERLKNCPPVLELPTDRPRPRMPGFRGKRLEVSLSVPLTQELKALGERHGATLFMTLLAAFKTLLHRYNGQRDMCVGTPVANRTRKELEGLIGCFVNTLVLRTDLSGDPPFSDLLLKIKKVSLDAYAHQECPFEKLVSELHPERELNRNPLCNVFFAFQNVPEQAMRLSNIALTPIHIHNDTAKVDLTLSISESAEALTGYFEYSNDLFDEATITRMVGHFLNLLAGMTTDPLLPISALPILTEGERQELLEWSGPRSAFQLLTPIHELFEERAAERPEAIAVVFHQQHLSYAHLNAAANRLAHLLLHLGTRPDALVGLCLDRSPDLIVAILAVLKAGAAYLPLDPQHPSARLHWMIADAQAQIVVTSEQYAPLLIQTMARLICLDSLASELLKQPAADLAVPLHPANLAYVIYTSGSTGTPKAALIEHRNLTRLFQATQEHFAFDEHETWTLFHSYGFDFSVWEMFGALRFGGKLVIVSEAERRDPDSFYEVLTREGVTVLNQTPTAFRQVMQMDEQRQARLSLRLVIFGGEALDFASLRGWVAQHGDQQPQLVNMYGITETCVHVTYRRIRRADVEASGGSWIGAALADLELQVLDEQGELVPVGVRGEIVVGGAGVCRGYLGRGEQTAERFVAGGSRQAGERLYRSGDVGRWLASGEVECLGRMDGQVKVRGYRIELGEIEAELRRQPEVRAAKVLVEEDASGEKRLVGYVVMDGELQVGRLRAVLKRRLPEYMVPGEYVQVEAMELTVNGKVDEAGLRRRGGRQAAGGVAYEAASSVRQQQMVAIWEEVLGAERVGINDNFFDLGGDSIRSLKILSLLTQRCGWRLSLQDLFENPTISELASIISDSCGSDMDESTAPFSLIGEEDRKRLPEGVEDAYPLTRLQAGMLFHSEYSPETAIYHNVSSFHLQATWELEKFQIAAQRLIARHPVLRTSFDLTSFSQPLQLVHRKFDFEIQVADLCHLPADEQEREVFTRFENQKQLKFDWTQAPLLRFHIQPLSQETFQFTLVEHHAILDGWSVALLLSELFRTYLSLLDEKLDAVEPDPKAKFRDFVALERKAIESEKDRAFWADKLSAISIAWLPRLPERKRAGEARTIIAQEVSISEEVSHGLRQLSSSAGTPLKSVLLAAHLKVISLLSSQRNITTGLVCNGRPETPDGERVLGLFLNTLPLSFNLDSGTWIELARRTFQAELELLPHRRFPLADLQKIAGDELLFETAFNFVHFHAYSDLLRMGNIRLLGEATYEETNFTLLANFSVDAESLQPHLQLVFDITELTDEQVSKINGYYSNTLAAMASDPFGCYEGDSPISLRELTQLQEWTKVNGKVDEAGLRRRGGQRAKSGAAYEAASSEQQQRMVAIWEEVLGAERVGVNDNFFDLGGDSIRAIQVSAKSRLNGLNVTVQQLFQFGTIRELTKQNISQQSELPLPLTVQPFSLISEEDRKRMPAGVEDAYPLTRLQAGMLFHSLYDDGGSTYHNVSSLRLQVALNIDCLRSALNRLSSRHPVLRTSVDLQGFSEPLQLVHREVSIPLQVEDLRHLSSFQEEQALALFFQDEKKSKFDWTKAPLLRFHVHQLTDQTIQFSWAEHHAILDGWSVASMLTELFQTYDDLLSHRPREIEALPAIAFRDFIAMERQVLESEESRNFWADNLRDSTITLLPRWPSPGRPLDGQKGLKEVHRVIAVSEGLKLLARSAAVPLKSVLLAAHLRVLSFLSGQLDVMTGLVANGRPEENGGERVLGLFLNTLPFRLQLCGGTWLQLAQEVFAAEQGLLPFRRYPLTQIQAITGGQPLFETIFNFVHFHVYDRLAKVAGLKIIGEESFIETNFTFEADCILDTAASDAHLILKYDSSELVDEQVESICGYYERTFEAMAKAPLENYESRTLLSDLESQQLLVDWVGAQTNYPTARSVMQLFERQVEDAPDAVALVDGENRLTYRELNGRANKLAHYLQSIGVRSERIVGIYLQRSSEMLVAVLGILKAGGVYLPLDPAYPKERLAFMIGDAQAHVLLTQAQLVENLAGIEARIVCLDADSQAINEESDKNPVIEFTADHLAYLIYTSGSTGKPKAVAMTHGPLLNLISWQIESLPGPSKTLQFASLSFDVSFQEIFSTWCSGGNLILVSEQWRRDARELLRIIETESVECVFIPFVVLQQMAGLVEAGVAAPGSLRGVITAGEQLKITPQVVSLFNKLGCPLHNHYGPSESHVVTAFTLAGSPGVWPSLPPIGKPISNTQIYLLDRHQQPVPIGTPGELHIGGGSLAREYWGRAELTAEKFIPNPFASSAGSRLYKTGDLARYLPDGNLEFLGRADNQVKLRGFRIELGEIEAALVEHAALRQSAVTIHEDSDGEKTLVAYVVSHDGATPATSELRMALMKKLPDYMVPTIFVSLDQLPLTPSGKVDRKSLPAPPRVRPMIEKPYVRPRRPVEQILAEIWAEVLRVDRVGIHDDFFELGGHSLSAIQLISRVRHRFDTELSLRRLFKNPTIAELGLVIEEELLEKVEKMTEADARQILKKIHGYAARGE